MFKFSIALTNDPQQGKLVGVGGGATEGAVLGQEWHVTGQSLSRFLALHLLLVSFSAAHLHQFLLGLLPIVHLPNVSVQTAVFLVEDDDVALRVAGVKAEPWPVSTRV